MAPTTQQSRQDLGFTLIELLVTIAVMGVITLPLGNFVIEYFRYTAETSAQINESHDAQIASAYFAQDVASTGTRNQATQTLNQSVWTGSASGAPYPCGPANPVVLLAGDQFASAGSPTVIEVAYVTVDVGTQHQLQRVVCTGTSASATTNVVAHDLDPGTAPSVTCYLNTATTNCDGNDAATPTSVRLKLTLKDPANTGASYELTLSGDRRQS